MTLLLLDAFFGLEIPTSGSFLLLRWINRLRWLAGGALLIGYLLSIYVPPRYRVVRYTMLAATLQLATMAELQDWLPDNTPSLLNLALYVFLPSLALFWVFLYFYAVRAGQTSVVQRLERLGLASAVALGLCLVTGFVATAGDTIRRMVDPDLFIERTSVLLLTIAYSYFAGQLLVVRRELGKLETLTEPEMPTDGPSA